MSFMLTIFTAPKPFRGLIDTIQRNAICSWMQMVPEVEVLLIGDEEGMEKVAAEYEIQLFPDVEKNELGTPLVSSIFKIARENSQFPNLCFVNADIILMDDLLPNVMRIKDRFEEYLIVGQRWDLSIPDLIAFDIGWVEKVRRDVTRSGRLHPPAGSDYFVFPRSTFEEIPPLAIGRAGWDNWMIYQGRARGIPVIDATSVITVIHQDHDYGHLPDGLPHYDLPESDRNVVLGGGAETVFRLQDADWTIAEGELKRRPLKDVGIVRSLETSVILRIGPGRITRILLAFLHPWETARYYFQAVKRRIRRNSQTSNEGSMG
jgi:hypothetical protein